MTPTVYCSSPLLHSITFPPSILRLAGLFVRRAPERVPGRQPSSLLGFAELQDELVGVSPNLLVEHFGRAGVRRIGENRALGVELEPRGFDFSAHGRRLDAMQGLGYIGGSARSGGMIENYIYATGLQRTVDGFVKHGGVNRPHELVMQVMIVLGNPEQVELFRELYSFERRGGRHREVWMG